MPVRVTPQQFREKHAANLKASLRYMEAGVNRVTEAPGEKAAQAQDKMRANLIDAIDTGKWATRVRSVSLQEWKTAMIGKGIPRVAAGIDGAASKVEAFATDLIAFENGLMNTVEVMPDVTLTDSVNRAVAWITGMAEFRRT